MSTDQKGEAVARVAQDYYNSDSADRFYYEIWGGEDIHIGLYESEEHPIREASGKTVERMMEILPPLTEDHQVLDIGAGYGGAARALARKYGCHVDCLNLSEVQNVRNREKNAGQGLESKIEVIDGSFEEIPFPADSHHVVWSQDAILHSGHRRQVLEEVHRVLKPGGSFIFTDPMQSDACPPGVLEPVLARIHLDSLGSPGFYRQVASELGWSERGFEDHTNQLIEHYRRVRQELESERARIEGLCGPEYVDRMVNGLGHWVEAGSAGYLCWGIFHFSKP